MKPTLVKLLILAVAGGLYVAGTFIPDVRDALTALAGLAVGLLGPQLGARK